MGKDYPDCHEPEKVCPTIAYRMINVGVPVTVTPLVCTGHPSVKCLGRPSICLAPPFCCNDKPRSCSFIIAQEVCVGVPVTIGATVSNDDPIVECGYFGVDAAPNDIKK